ncbi:hypothetical protein BGW39_011474 [Mortierella sp. 14UC]|nr:hypothetical protein BGW39_011474 [Mortierella sp. 14UC]
MNELLSTLTSLRETGRERPTSTTTMNVVEKSGGEFLCQRETLGERRLGLVFGCVWRRRRVVVKAQPLHRLQEAAQEAMMQRDLRHDNIVGHIGDMQDDKLVYTVMEHCGGGVFHAGRLKPANLVMTGDAIKICDFGMTRLWAEDAKGQDGTPAFMAPEVLKNEEYGLEADLYSLGALLHEMICAEVPTADDSKLGDIDMDAQDLVSKLISTHLAPVSPCSKSLLTRLWQTPSPPPRFLRPLSSLSSCSRLVKPGRFPLR